jgi:hypothetical protein
VLDIHLLTGCRDIEFIGSAVIVVTVNLYSYNVSQVVIPASQTFDNLIHLVISPDGHKQTFVVVQYLQLSPERRSRFVDWNILLVISLPRSQLPAGIIQLAVNYGRRFYAQCGVNPVWYTVRAAGAIAYAAGSSGRAAGAIAYAAGAAAYAAGAVGYAAGAVGYAAGAVGYAAGAVGYAAGTVGYAAVAVGYAAGAIAYAAGSSGRAAGAVGYAAACMHMVPAEQERQQYQDCPYIIFFHYWA